MNVYINYYLTKKNKNYSLCKLITIGSEFIYLKSLPEYEILKDGILILDTVYNYNDFK